MGKMGQLNAEGVTDLHSYNIGYEACRIDVEKMITNSLRVEGLEKMPATWALRILLISLREDEDDEVEENTEASS